MKFIIYASVALGALALAACDGGDAKAPAATATIPSPTTSSSGTGFIVPDVGPAAGKGTPATPAPAFSAVTANIVAYSPPPADATVQNAVLLRAQVLLDRAGFSPGVIDARHGENVRQALAAFQEARGLPRDGTLNPATWDALQTVGGPSVVGRYVITRADLAGPFIAGVPDQLSEQAHLTALSYTSAAELIAERFHMDEDLLRAMNPGVNFDGAGQEIMVANPARPPLAANVARIEVDAGEKAIRAYDAAGALLAFYPATIGSREQPSPTGAMKVNGVARHPTYTYDPRKEAGGQNKPLWIVMPGGTWTSPTTLTGTVYVTGGIPFNQPGSNLRTSPVGSFTFNFSDAANGQFSYDISPPAGLAASDPAYTLPPMSGTKAITRQSF